jgi:hypothetical protein
MTTAPRPVPDVLLEQYHLRELPAGELERIRLRLETDPVLRTRHAQLAASDEEIARRYPPHWLAARIRTRQPAAARPLATALPLGLAAAAAMLVLLMVPRSSPSRVVSSVAAPVMGTEGTRMKGLRPSLTVYRRTASGSETLADGSIARPGDLLRVGYGTAGQPFGVIFSVDGRGVVTRHLPATGDRAAALTAGHAVLLDQAYELDDAPGWERFYFITGDVPFALAPVIEAARQHRTTAARTPVALPLPRGLSQSTFTLQKEVRP